MLLFSGTESVSPGKSSGIDSLPFCESRHRNTCVVPRLAGALILREIKCLAAAIVNSRKDHRTAVG